jgi:predicted RecB family nuclease
MPITRQVVEGYLHCKYKAHLLVNGRTGIPHDLEIVQAELQSGYREKAAAILLRKGSKAAHPFASSDIRSGNPVILGSTLENGTTVFAFDALRRMDGKSRLGPFHYGPVLFYQGETVGRHQRFLLAISGIILSQHQGIQPKSGLLIHGANCRSTTVQLAPQYAAAQKTLDDLSAIANGKAAPRLILNDHCALCEFRAECHEQALKADDLSLLGHMTEKKIAQYAQTGTLTVTQLSHTYHARRHRNLHPKQNPHSLPLHALAIRQQRILVVGKPAFPKGTVRIYFDAEGDFDRKFTYLLGLLIVKDGKEKMVSLWADDPSQQKRLFEQFLDVLNQYPGYALFHYGQYEAEILRKVRAAVRPKKIVDVAIAASVNVLAPLHSNVYFPTYSNGLKDIGKYLGFSWTDASASGLQSLAWRKRWEMTGSDEFKQKLVVYNGDDCRALKRVAESLEAIGQEQNSVTEGSAAAWEEVTFEPNHRDWGKIGFVLPEFDHINECAYFDYQHDRVYLRGVESRQRHRRARLSPKKRRRQRPTLQKEITSSKCPRCGCSQLTRVGRRVFKKQAFDLVMRPSGVIRRIIEYIAERKKCTQCHRQFLPTKYRRVDPYHHGLKSWVVFQHVEHLVSLSRLILLCEEFFRIRLHLTYVCMIKSMMAERYRPTIKLLMQRLLAGNVIYVDETEISLHHGKGYVWVLTNFEEVVYLFRPNRESGFLKELLKGFHGVVVSDFFSGYDGLECLQQKCLIHLIRDMNTDLRLNPFDDELKLLTGNFATLLRGIVDTIDRHGLSSKWLMKHKPQAVAFLNRVCGAEYRSQVAQGYKERFTKYRDRLFVFLELDGVSWNNNDAEHAIKYFAHYRMLVDGTVVENTLNDHLVLLSVCVTCKYKHVSFLRFMLSREHDIDTFARRRKVEKRKRSIELYPKGFPNRNRKPLRPSNKGTEELADKNGVGALFKNLLAGLKGYFAQVQLTTVGTALSAILQKNGTYVQVMSLVVRDSSMESGLRYTVYMDRFAKYFGIERTIIRRVLPDLEADQRGGRFSGRSTGHFRAMEDVDRFLNVIKKESPRTPR